MFDMFPYVNLHKINLDWIITTVQRAVITIQHSVRQIDAALDTVSGLTGRVNNLEDSVQQLQEANTSLLDRMSHAETQLTSMQADIRQQGSTLDTLGQSVSALSTAVSGKVDNGSGTITGSANLLTVASVNSGEEVSIDGTAVTITGTGGNDVMMALDTVGEPGASESVLRLVRHDDTSPGPVRITNVGLGQAASDAVNVDQMVVMTRPLIIDIALLTGGSCTVQQEFNTITTAIYNGRNVYARITSSPDNKYTNQIFPATLFRDTGVASGRSIMFHGFNATQYYPTLIIRGYAPSTWSWVERST